MKLPRRGFSSNRGFEYHHYRRLIPLVAQLALLTLTWSLLVIIFATIAGGTALIWNIAFAQNLIASLLVLPIGLAIGVVVGTFVQKHSIRFQVRHGADRLVGCVRGEVFRFILFLKNECKIPVDIAGRIDHRFFRRARSAVRSFLASSRTPSLPPDFEVKLDEVIEGLSSCFEHSTDLRLAFPRSFDLLEGLQNIYRSIKVGSTRSDLIEHHLNCFVLRDRDDA